MTSPTATVATKGSTETDARGSTRSPTTGPPAPGTTQASDRTGNQAPATELAQVPLGPGDGRVELTGSTVAGLTARYAERVGGVARLVATGEAPFVDTRAAFAVDEAGRPVGPVDVTATVRIVGIPVARVDAAGLAWQPGSPLPGPVVAVQGQAVDISGPGTVEVRPSLPRQAVPGATRVVLPPALADLATGQLVDTVVELARELIVGGPDAAPPILPASDAAPPPELGGDAAPRLPETAATEPEVGAAERAAEPGAVAPAGAAPAEGGPAAEEEPAEAEAPPPVELIMPPAPTGPGEAQQGRIRGVSRGAQRAASAARDLPDAAQTTKVARGAVDEPQTEANARAASDLAAQLGGAPPPSPEILKLCDSIYTAIRSKRPADEDELTKADIKGAAEAAGQTLDGSIKSDSDRVAGSYNTLQQTPTGAADAGTPVVPPDTGVADPGIDAQSAAPDPVPDEDLSLDADRDRVETMATENRVERHTTEPLVKTEPFSGIREGRAELGEMAATAPADLAAQQATAIAQAQSDMRDLQAQALQSLQASRGRTAGGVGERQGDMVRQEVVTRESVSAAAQKIFDQAQTDVQTMLEPLARNAMAMWDTELDHLSTQFRTHLNRVQSWINERHAGAGGLVVGLWDAVTGLPGWVTDEYDDAERAFGDGVCKVLLKIDADVSLVIAAARARVQDARDQTHQLFTDLPDDLKEWAAGEQQRFQTQLDGLDRRTEQTRMGFVAEISQRAVTAVGDVQREIEELRKKAGGLIGRIVAAIEAFIDDPVKAIINGLLSLLGIAPASFWALVDRIAQVIDQLANDPETFGNNLVEALRMGFQLFLDHFGTHLMAEFWKWLFSRCGSVGVTVPKDASLRSIITFVLSIMGITWPNIRRILVREVGERNVELIEKVWELVSILIRAGPDGIVTMIQEQLTPEAIVEAVLEVAIEVTVQLLVERVAVQLLSMLNPVGAVLQAIRLIYTVLKWIFENAARIFAFVETVVNAAVQILAGDLASVAILIEKALASLLPVVIDLFMSLIGLSDLPEKVAQSIGQLQNLVLPVVEAVIVNLINRAKALLASLGLGGEEQDEDGKGGDDGELGTTVHFRAGGEGHRIWVKVVGEAGQLVMASSPEPMTAKVSEWRQQVDQLPEDDPDKAQATTLLDQVESLIAATDAEATRVKQQQDAAKQDNDPDTEPPSDDAVESDERQLANLLVRLYQLLEPDLAEIVGRIAAVLPGRADTRAEDLARRWAHSLSGIQVGPVDQRVALLADASTAMAGATGAAGASATGDTSTQQALAGYFLTAARDRSADTEAFYDYAFVARRPQPPHPLRPDFTTALGNAALATLRSYVEAQLNEATTALSEEEKAGIRDMVADAAFVMSGDVGRFTGLRTREPDHAFFKPKTIAVQADGTLTYTTESGQTFLIEETADGLPTRVVGENLTKFSGRGVTQDSPYFVKNQDFNRAHVIANELRRFGLPQRPQPGHHQQALQPDGDARCRDQDRQAHRRRGGDRRCARAGHHAAAGRRRAFHARGGPGVHRRPPPPHRRRDPQGPRPQGQGQGGTRGDHGAAQQGRHRQAPPEGQTNQVRPHRSDRGRRGQDGAEDRDRRGRMVAQREPVNAVDALAELTGRDPVELRRHPRLLLPALGELGRSVVTTALELGDADPDVRAGAERRRVELMQALTDSPRRPSTS